MTLGQMNTASLTDGQFTILKQVNTLENIQLPKSWTSETLLETEFPPVRWVVPGLIPEGLTILAGAPKLGKSWLALQLGVALSLGGHALGKIEVPETEVLYISLEDTPRRLKNRLEKLDTMPSKKFHLVTEWPRLPGAIDMLSKWYYEHPGTGVVIIDTLGKVWGSDRTNDYNQDTAQIAKLKAFADTLGLAVIVVHHTRKMAADDFLYAVTGSVGITGAADTTIVLSRGRGQADALLQATGRDIDEQELALKFDRTVGTWEILGDAAEIQSTRTKQEIYDLLKDAGEPMSPKAIGEALKNIDADNIRQALKRMVDKDRTLQKRDRGLYEPVNTCHNRHNVTMESDLFEDEKAIVTAVTSTPEGCHNSQDNKSPPDNDIVNESDKVTVVTGVSGDDTESEGEEPPENELELF